MDFHPTPSSWLSSHCHTNPPVSVGLGTVLGDLRQGQSLGAEQGPCGALQGSALLHRPQTCCAEGNHSMGLKDHLENINSSLLMVCLKIPINVYTHVPGQHVYPQLMALSGSWNDLCITTEQTPSPPSFALFLHRLLLTSSNPIPITASHLPLNVNKSCVVRMAATSTEQSRGSTTCSWLWKRAGKKITGGRDSGAEPWDGR